MSAGRLRLLVERMLKNIGAVWVEKRRWDGKKPERRDVQRELQNDNYGDAIIVLLSE